MSNTNDEECVVCCRKCLIYAIGNCDHPVCFECSARMRVLCETNECPICRSDIPVVYFSKTLKPFSAVNKKSTLLNKKYKILFEDGSVLKEFELLLEYRCPTCSEVLPNFEKLKDHARRKHELHYCELCTDNLKIFPFERKAYSRKDLARHKRLGDPDMTSHQGHPLCKFCDQRYVDSDDLFRHLRRDHFFCYFCDADGKNQYYSNYEELRVHFRKDHYLCEEGDCAEERFTSAFRTDIDLKSHKATHHCKNKADSRQTRMLDLEFNYAPLTRPSGNTSPRSGRYGQYRRDRRNVEENESRSQQPAAPVEVEDINTQSVQEFPYLSEDGISKVANGHSAREAKSTNQTSARQPYSCNPNPYGRSNLSADQFPALGSKSSSSSAPSNQSNSIKQNNSSRGHSASNQKSTFAQNLSAASSDQKSKSAAETKSGEKNSKWNANKSKLVFEEEFPQLTIRDTCPTTSASALSSNNFVSAIKNIKEPEPKPLPDFLVVKPKSKKKKHVVVTKETEYKEESKPALAEPPVTDKSEDRFKSHMVHPLLASTSAPYRISDTWEEKVSFGNADFPPLAPSAPPKKPPGFKPRAPPGFSQNSNPKPPAKNLTLSAVADILKQSQGKVNGFDSASNHNYIYLRPPHFDQRNQDLIIRITTLPGHDKEMFQEFKQMSGSFRANHISAAVFHNKCLEMLGRCAFQDIFADLVTLLPDISKQRELLDVHNKYLWDKEDSPDRYPITSCEICNQVLMNRDEKYHRQMHESS